MVVHFASTTEQNAPLVGFVVSKAVGNAVTRNLVKRRLRALMREQLKFLPLGSLLVVRALPNAASVNYAKLNRDLDSCLRRVLPEVESLDRDMVDSQ